MEIRREFLSGFGFSIYHIEPTSKRLMSYEPSDAELGDYFKRTDLRLLELEYRLADMSSRGRRAESGKAGG